jgi:hypothetical protein
MRFSLRTLIVMMLLGGIASTSQRVTPSARGEDAGKKGPPNFWLDAYPCGVISSDRILSLKCGWPQLALTEMGLHPQILGSDSH